MQLGVVGSRMSILVVVAGWLALVTVFAGRYLRAWGPQLWRLRAWGHGIAVARLGLLVQGLGFASLLVFHRPYPGSAGSSMARDVLLAVIVLLLVAFSIAFVIAALRTLGREWAFDARVIEGHRLVTTGPYARVRHPIYTGMGTMLIATGLVASSGWGFVIGVGLYTLGTALRVRAEERLLTATFGVAYRAYRDRVPAVLPRIPDPRV